MKRDEAIVGVVIFLFGAITTFLSLKMPIGTLRMAGTGFFPLCLGILLMILSAAYVFRLFVQYKKIVIQKETAVKTPGAMRQMGLFLGAMVLATLFFNELGYPLTSFLLMAALLRSLGMKRWAFNILLSFITAGVSYFLFVQWLKIPLPKGWIGL
ncbi:MAG: tripartite tricarboxylate transporter TctB family protein [Deltaproteobacteria bacterium]|nr:tripartite tricarboxylate transporter TctB family protein [Deltaproteobacteria bacterium]